jgi:dTMP kinase
VRGKFITFEGVEGSGKSTQLARLAEFLKKEHGLPVRTTREPGEGLGKDLRDLMLERAHFLPWTMACLMSADRAEHVARVIEHGLKIGEWVLCDRFTDSTLAYQGGGLGVPREALDVLNAQATGGLTPDLTLVFDLDVDHALARVRARSPFRKLDRFESAERAFHERVRAAYRTLAQDEPARVRLIDAEADEAAVFARMRVVLAPLLTRTT